MTAIDTINPSDIESWCDTHHNRALIDVNEFGEFIMGHAPHFVCIPRGHLPERMRYLIPDSDTAVLLMCSDGRRSARAAAEVRALGYRSVTVVDGGLATYTGAGMPIEQGSNVLGKRFGELLAAQEDVEQLTPRQVDELAANGPVALFDVRTTREFEGEGHLPGAVSAPGHRVAHDVSALRRKQPDTPVILNCAGRTRSIVAAEKLSALGIQKVYALQNGTMAWLLDGRELDSRRADGDDAISESPDLDADLATAAARLAQQQQLVSESAGDLMARLRRGEPLYLVDVRAPADFSASTIPGARSCPDGQLTNQADDVMAVRSTPVYCFSTVDVQAILAARTLAGMGFEQVRWIRGGFRAWVADSLPTQPGRVPMPPPVTPHEALFLQNAADLASSGSLRTGNQVVDVRSVSAFVAEHVPGATWIPFGLLDLDAGEHLDTSRPILLIGDHDTAAARGARLLADLGFQACGLRGGIASWVKAGLAVESGADGNNIDMTAAREEVDIVGFGPVELRRTKADMRRYLEWEIALGSDDSRTPAGSGDPSDG